MFTLRRQAEPGGVHAPALISAKAVHCASDGFVQALSFDFYRVLDALAVTVADSAERHQGESIISPCIRRTLPSCFPSSTIGASLFSGNIRSEPSVFVVRSALSRHSDDGEEAIQQPRYTADTRVTLTARGLLLMA